MTTYHVKFVIPDVGSRKELDETISDLVIMAPHGSVVSVKEQVDTFLGHYARDVLGYEPPQPPPVQPESDWTDR